MGDVILSLGPLAIIRLKKRRRTQQLKEKVTWKEAGVLRWQTDPLFEKAGAKEKGGSAWSYVGHPLAAVKMCPLCLPLNKAERPSPLQLSEGASQGGGCPHLPLVPHYSHHNKQQVRALLVTCAEATQIHGNQSHYHRDKYININEFGRGEGLDQEVSVILQPEGYPQVLDQVRSTRAPERVLGHSLLTDRLLLGENTPVWSWELASGRTVAPTTALIPPPSL